MGCGASLEARFPGKMANNTLNNASSPSLIADDSLVKPCIVEKEDGSVSTTPSSNGASLATDSRPDSRSTAFRPESRATNSSAAFSVQPLPVWPRKMLVDAEDHAFMIFSVFSFLPWSQRGDAMCISRGMRRFFNSDDAYGQCWRWHCECLCSEALLFLPESAPRPFSPSAHSSAAKSSSQPDGVDYRALFGELWPARFRFLDEAGERAAVASMEAFKVSVFCRMRPAPPAALFGGFCEELLSAPVTLPLGQRVALLRQRHPEFTRKEAMMALLNNKCGAAAPMDEGEEEDDDEFRALKSEIVDCNARPQTGAKSGALAADVAMSVGTGFNASVLNVTPGLSGSVLTVSPGIGIRKWEYQKVFDESSSQREIYETCGHRLSTNLVNGQSGSLIVYGQTGSGKTHTMFGPPQVGDGLVHRIVDDVLQAVQERRSAGFKAQAGVSIIEVFGNDVSNLLGKTGAAKLCARMGTKYVLDGKYEHPVQDRAAFASLLGLGEERKRKAHTEMNERSTRAHTIVIVRLRQRAPGQEKAAESILSLVDLGGSERVNKSKANDNIRAPGAVNVGNDGEVSRVTWGEYYKSRERLTETNNINKGLLALKRCVQALNERQQRAKEGRPLVRVPYTDSKLTLLLQPALSGEANTSIVVCCSHEDRHAEETVQSLRFGEICGSVEHARKEATSDAGAAVADALRQIDSQIKEVEEAIRSKEKWEWKMTTRTDVIDEMDTGAVVCNKGEVMELGGAGSVEIAADDGTSKKRTVEHEVWSQVLVGAEAENARRDELIKTRQRLLGGD